MAYLGLNLADPETDLPPNPRCYWVIKDRLLAGAYPFNTDPKEAKARLRSLIVRGGVRVFLNLTEPGERTWGGHLKPYASLAKQIGKELGVEIRCIRAAIPDMGVTSVEDYQAMWEEVDREIAEGKCVYQHCFPAGTLVGGPTPTAIEHATYVTGHDGKQHRVTRHMSRPYDGPLTVIKSGGALPVKCTPEHPVLIVRPFRYPGGSTIKPGWSTNPRVKRHYADQPMWVEAKDIQVGDFLVSPRGDFSGDSGPVSWPNRPSARAFKPLPLQPEPNTAWMLGLYAANGGPTGENGICFTLKVSADVDRLVAVWERMGITPDVVRSETYIRVKINSRVIYDGMAQWCGKSKEKRLPGFIFDGWPLRDVLEGYTAGDGYCNSRNHLVASSISPVLTEQIRSILTSLGESPTVAPEPRHSGYPNAKPMNAVRWSPTATQRHSAWWKAPATATACSPGQWLYLLPVKAIGTERYQGTVHNLEVDKAETYTVSGVAVHNCWGGIGRTGTVTAGWMLRHGYAPPETLIRTLDHLRTSDKERWDRQAPQSPEQCRMVFRANGLENLDWDWWASHQWERRSYQVNGWKKAVPAPPGKKLPRLKAAEAELPGLEDPLPDEWLRLPKSSRAAEPASRPAYSATTDNRGQTLMFGDQTPTTYGRGAYVPEDPEAYAAEWDDLPLLPEESEANGYNPFDGYIDPHDPDANEEEAARQDRMEERRERLLAEQPLGPITLPCGCHFDAAGHIYPCVGHDAPAERRARDHFSGSQPVPPQPHYETSTPPRSISGRNKKGKAKGPAKFRVRDLSPETEKDIENIREIIKKLKGS